MHTNIILITLSLAPATKKQCFFVEAWFVVHNKLRRLERDFHCCSVCETMEDYKEGYLMVWTNYMSPCSSIVWLYFKGTCDIISVTMAMHKVHRSVL